MPSAFFTVIRMEISVSVEDLCEIFIRDPRRNDGFSSSSERIMGKVDRVSIRWKEICVMGIMLKNHGAQITTIYLVKGLC